MKLHVVSLPHTQTLRDEFSWCAYTTKVRRFCDMMMSLDYEVILYAGAENDANVSELVPCITRDEQAEHFGTEIPAFDESLPGWQLFNERVIDKLRSRLGPQDLLCLIGGRTQAPIAAEFPGAMAVEFGVGYSGVFALYRVFESYAWMHAVYGDAYGADRADGLNFDAVIPNYYDLEEFPLGKGGDYLLYMGRLIERKGLRVVDEVQRRTGLPLVVAGGDGDEIPANCEYVGKVGPKERADLMGGARCTLVPTQYLEPFGGVAVESMLCGTPVVTTDWGAFTETVSPGVSGFRCRTLAQFCEGIDRAFSLPRESVRHWAQQFDMRVIRHRYHDYFGQLATLWEDGWYAL